MTAVGSGSPPVSDSPPVSEPIPEVGPAIDSDHEYRINVLASLKAIAWLSVPVVFAIMAVSGVGEGIANWADYEIFNNKIAEWTLSPFLWAGVAALAAVAAYSTVIKWIWDAWDKREKYPERPAE